VIGRDALRPRYQALFSGFAPAIEGHVEEVCVSGRVAWLRGHNGGRLVARGEGGDHNLDDVYLMLLRRDEKGAWRITHLMWHRASAAPR
jgi:ketosteroid isomerase-like protein